MANDLRDNAKTLNSSRKAIAPYENRPGWDILSLATLERAKGLWYPDGNLIIHAGASIFRVFRGILAEKSPVLEGLLSPRSLETFAVLDGCPVLTVSYASDEITHFLAAIFKPRCVLHAHIRMCGPD